MMVSRLTSTPLQPGPQLPQQYRLLDALLRREDRYENEGQRAPPYAGKASAGHSGGQLLLGNSATDRGPCNGPCVVADGQIDCREEHCSSRDDIPRRSMARGASRTPSRKRAPGRTLCTSVSARSRSTRSGCQIRRSSAGHRPRSEAAPAHLIQPADAHTIFSRPARSIASSAPMTFPQSRG